MPTTTLRWPLTDFRRYIRETLAAQSHESATPRILQVGLHKSAERKIWLARGVVPWSDNLRNAIPFTQWVIGTRVEPPGAVIEIPPFASGRLDFGQGLWSDYAWGAIREGDTTRPLDMLDLIGSGLHRIDLTPNSQGADTNLRQALHEENAREFRSRTIGALGGYDVWQRLIRQRVALVGVGRTGSLIATHLARLGLRELVLIDPDSVEPHNIGEMDGVTQRDIGRPKVEAVADDLVRIQQLTSMTIDAIALSADSTEAHRAIVDCDIVIGAVDEDAPRLLLGWGALDQHQILLDIGTGILPSSHSDSETTSTRTSISDPYPRHMGCDVRLIVPGEGCLMCHGGVLRYREAMETLTTGSSTRVATQQWDEGRAGSFRTLNMIAASVGLQLLQDLAAGRVTGSRWTRIEIDDTGHIGATHLPAGHDDNTRSCTWCKRAGRGDITLEFM